MHAINAKYILTSYSTDGTIPLISLVEACIRRGRTDFVQQQYKRYRVSSQRFSDKPVNVELILIVNTQEPHTGLSANEICDSILYTEKEALYFHSENDLNRTQQITLF